MSYSDPQYYEYEQRVLRKWTAYGALACLALSVAADDGSWLLLLGIVLMGIHWFLRLKD